MNKIVLERAPLTGTVRETEAQRMTQPAAWQPAEPSVDPIRVMLADDHHAVRSAVRADLEDGGLEVCGEAVDADTAVSTAVLQQPQVCLLDIRMPGNGIAAAWDITQLLTDTKVVMLTMSRNEENMLFALRAGAVGYLLKDIEGERLIEQVKAFAHDSFAIPAVVAGRLLDELTQPSGGGRGLLRRKKTDEPSVLTDRERRILELLQHGYDMHDTAATLGVSEYVVRTDVGTLRKKARYAHRDELMAVLTENVSSARPASHLGSVFQSPGDGAD